MNVILTRRSLRSFAKTPVSSEDLESLFEAFRWGPSCMNKQVCVSLCVCACCVLDSIRFALKLSVRVFVACSIRFALKQNKTTKPTAVANRSRQIDRSANQI